MKIFRPIERVQDGLCGLTTKQGVYKQTEVYRMGGFLYAKHGTGFIKLGKHGTSVASIRLDGIDVPFRLTTNVHGWYVDVEYKE